MYLDFYGFKMKPFSKTPDPQFLYESRMHKEALERMKFAVEERDIALITGEIGCGKTTLIRALLDYLDEDYYPVLIDNPKLTPFQFLKTLAKKLGVKEIPRSRAEVIDSIEDSIFSFYEEDITPVIIVDEAQLIPGKETFEELRILTNFQLDDENLFSLLLVGQPELRKKLSSSMNKAFWQRIGIHYIISPLTEEETGEYIRFRLEKAGGEPNIFTDGAVRRVFFFSQGIPRMINHLCSNALIEGFTRDVRTIDERIVESVAFEMGTPNLSVGVR